MHRINNYKKHNSEAITENGITLIALIITIIVMLILVTVVVTRAIDGGLFEYAKTAKDNTEIASEKEGIEKAYIIAQGTSRYGTVSETEFQKALDKVMGEDQAEVMANGKTFVIKIGERYYEIDKKGKISDTIEYAGDKTLAEYIAEINEKRLPEGWTISETIPTDWDENKVKVITDGTNIVPLPKGYRISDIEGEQAVATGLVIKDSNGNEFVWIPVYGTLSKPYTGGGASYEEPKVLTYNYSSSGKAYDSQGTLNYLYGTNYFDYANEFKYEEEYVDMVESVNKYHGFYIGRYETTIDAEGNVGSVYNTPILTSDKSIVIKEGKIAQTCRWYGLYYLQKTTDYVVGNGTKVQTAMIYGQLWDKMLEYFDSEGNGKSKTDYTTTNLDSLKSDSKVNLSGISTYGDDNHSDVILNIYDLRANGTEWTQEASPNSWRVMRRRQIRF